MKELEKLSKRGTDFLGTKYAILAGAMSWVSEHNLVSSISNNGGFGILACSSMTPDMLREEIKKTKALTKNPFGVNLIIMHPDLEKLINICAEEKVTHVVLAGGMATSKMVASIKDFGGKVICFTPTVAVGTRLIRMGVDALIIEGMEAGGHIGPVSTSVLAQEILPKLAKDIPIFVAGGIGHGEAIAAYLRMGASGCQLGTMFVCAKESIAHPNFKKAFIKSAARNATVSVQIDPEFNVIPVRAIDNKAKSDFMKVQIDTIAKYKAGQLSKEEAQLNIEHYWAGALRKAVIDGDVESGSLMAGQSVGMVKSERPVSEIIDDLVNQTVQAL